MIKIRQLVIKNIGPYREQLFDFSIQKGHPDIHVLTGANGTGKTTILHALAGTFDYFERKDDHKEQISNNFHKRFHFFEENEKEMAHSYTHTVILDDNDTNKILDKVVSYGCKTCGNIHQNYDKTTAHNFKVTEYGASYKFEPNFKEFINYKNAIVAKDLSNKKFKFAAFAYSGYRFIKSSNVVLDDSLRFNPLHLALEFVKEKDTAFRLTNWISSRYSKAAIEETLGNKELAKTYKAALNSLIESINGLTDNEYTIKIETNPWKVGLMYFGKMLEFDVLPDGLRSILSWLGDLLMRPYRHHFHRCCPRRRARSRSERSGTTSQSGTGFGASCSVTARTLSSLVATNGPLPGTFPSCLSRSKRACRSVALSTARSCCQRSTGKVWTLTRCCSAFTPPPRG